MVPKSEPKQLGSFQSLTITTLATLTLMTFSVISHAVLKFAYAQHVLQTHHCGFPYS